MLCIENYQNICAKLFSAEIFQIYQIGTNRTIKNKTISIFNIY